MQQNVWGWWELQIFPTWIWECVLRWFFFCRNRFPSNITKMFFFSYGIFFSLSSTSRNVYRIPFIPSNEKKKCEKCTFNWNRNHWKIWNNGRKEGREGKGKAKKPYEMVREARVKYFLNHFELIYAVWFWHGVSVTNELMAIVVTIKRRA